MNKVILMGRLTRDPDYKKTEKTNIAKYTLAVDRRSRDDADFVNCTAFGKGADFAALYLKKGTKVVVTGRIQTGCYEKDGQKVYTTEVIVEDHEFAESKKASEAPETGFVPMPADVENLPFN